MASTFAVELYIVPHEKTFRSFPEALDLPIIWYAAKIFKAAAKDSLQKPPETFSSITEFSVDEFWPTRVENFYSWM